MNLNTTVLVFLWFELVYESDFKHLRQSLSNKKVLSCAFLFLSNQTSLMTLFTDEVKSEFPQTAVFTPLPARETKLLLNIYFLIF